MSGKYEWLMYVALAGLAWGTYVPLIFYGGNELGGKPSSRIMAILCVGLAYFVIGVLVPLVLFLTGQYEWPELTGSGLTFASLAGVAGAVGALCVIFASKSATGAAIAAGHHPATYRLYIAPLIFGLAPVINTLVAIIWHPQKGEPFHFGFHLPGWKLWVGIVLVGLGAALVLFSKEEAEAHAPKAVAHKPAVSAEHAGHAGGETMSPEEAMECINVVFAHAWMVRNFLKHADEVQDDEEMLEVHRTVFDCIRAVEPSYQRKDAKEYLHRCRGKLAKLRKAADDFAANYRRVSDHTNFEMAARSLSGCVRHIDDILGTVEPD